MLTGQKAHTTPPPVDELLFSASPDRRERAAIAGKIKRAVLESGGEEEQFATACGSGRSHIRQGIHMRGREGTLGKRP